MTQIERIVKAESVLHAYVCEAYNATQCRNRLATLGFEADLRTFLGNKIDLIDCRTTEGAYITISC